MYFKFDLSLYMFVIIFFNKTNVQSCKEKSTRRSILKRMDYNVAQVEFFFFPLHEPEWVGSLVKLAVVSKLMMRKSRTMSFGATYD
jgi:hypothetical protein